MYCTELYCTLQHCVVLYCTILYCTGLKINQPSNTPVFLKKSTGFYLFCFPGLPQLKNFATSMLVRGHNHARLVRRLHADNFEQKFIACTDSARGDDADC